MTLLSYEEWKEQVGIIENKHDILHLTEEAHGRDARLVIEEHLKQLYDQYVSENQGV